jgi:hypothetical protein
MVHSAVSQGLYFITEGRRESPRGIAATKGIKTTTDYTDGTDKDGDGQSRLSSAGKFSTPWKKIFHSVEDSQKYLP